MRLRSILVIHRLGKYLLTAEDSTYTIATLQEEKYFAGRRLIPQDRLGSAADAWLTPYGTELVSAGKPPTANDRVKFARITGIR